MAKRGLGKTNKAMDAENVTELRYLLAKELERLKGETSIDILMFMGVDGRIFSSLIPTRLNPEQFYMLNLVKSNLPHICSQLNTENLTVSTQVYEHGTLIIAGVGSKAFLACLIARKLDLTQIEGLLKSVNKASVVLKHIFELKAITEKTLAAYDEDIQVELKELSRLLFVDRFEHTRTYKKNMEIQKYLKAKIAEVVGVGQVEEIMTLCLNELGTTAAYMTDKLWLQFTEKVIKEHIQRISGDIIADNCYRTWMPEVERKLKSFV